MAFCKLNLFHNLHIPLRYFRYYLNYTRYIRGLFVSACPNPNKTEESLLYSPRYIQVLGSLYRCVIIISSCNHYNDLQLTCTPQQLGISTKLYRLNSLDNALKLVRVTLRYLYIQTHTVTPDTFDLNIHAFTCPAT